MNGTGGTNNNNNNKHTTETGNTSSPDDAVGTNCQHDYDDSILDVDTSSNTTPAVVQQHAKQAAHASMNWRTSSTARAEVVEDPSSSSNPHRHSSSTSSTTPPRTTTSTLHQLHLPGPMNAVLQGPTETFRHFVRGWADVGSSSVTTAVVTGSVLTTPMAQQSLSSWIPPPLTLRHSVSTPTVHRHDAMTMMMMIGDDPSTSAIIPPPIPLDPFQRSTSTPSAFTDCSTSSTTMASRSHASAIYASPAQQFLRPDTYQQEHRSSPHAFGPVQFYSLALLEHTSIEVQQQQQHQSGPASTNGHNHSNKRSARRFLSEVRVLRRRRQSPPVAAYAGTTVADVVTVVTSAAATDEASGSGRSFGVVDGATSASIENGRNSNTTKEPPSVPLARRPPRRDRAASPLTATSTRIRTLSRRRSHSHSPQATARVNSLSAAFATLTTISETDREVMELNTNSTSQYRGQQRRLQSGSLSSDTSIRSIGTNGVEDVAVTTTARYVPTPREGASLPAERFFVDHDMEAPSSTTTTATGSCSTTGSGAAATKQVDPLPPRFVSYALDGTAEIVDDDDDDDDDDDNNSARGGGLLLDDQREESPIIMMDDSSSCASAAAAATTSNVGRVLLYVQPRSHWRCIASEAATTTARGESAIAAALELLPLNESIEVERTTPSKDVFVITSGTSPTGTP